jgi:hypothetical protein
VVKCIFEVCVDTAHPSVLPLRRYLLLFLLLLFLVAVEVWHIERVQSLILNVTVLESKHLAHFLHVLIPIVQHLGHLES